MMSVQFWRLIDSDLIKGATSQAIDEALFQARVKGIIPDTLHLYRRKPPAVSIGRFQNVEDVVDLEFCRKQGIDILRRISGGREVYTDSNCLEYAVVLKQKYKEIPLDIEGSFKAICQGIIMALTKLDIDASYKPINDVLVGGKKISGNAQRRREQILLQHGTLLIDADYAFMGNIFNLGEKGTAKLMKKLTTIKGEAQRTFTVKEVKEALIAGFQESLSMKLVKNKLTTWETEKIDVLTKKYCSDAWIFKKRLNKKA